MLGLQACSCVYMKEITTIGVTGFRSTYRKALGRLLQLRCPRLYFQGLHMLWAMLGSRLVALKNSWQNVNI